MPVLDAIDETADVLFVQDEWTDLESPDRLAHVLIGILEPFERPARTNAGFRLDVVLQRVADQLLQSAVGVVHEDDFASPQQPLRQDQRTNHVVGDDPARVANDVCIAVGQSEHLEDVHPAVHAGDDGQLSAWPQGEVMVGERLDVPGVVGKQFVGARFEQCVTVCGHNWTVAP